ncbi:MAG TPA: glycoside hydrolase domain-containing protein [Pyrinomonadaceae bacterium]|nr:glycoside hydrolase domain-containing protein [Pyrinomonadaceae bacterium]
MAIFLGLDKSSYPGDKVMKLARTQANIVFTGLYLGPAPSHPDTSWMTKRSFLSGLGFGFAPIYVGQQQSGGPGSHILSTKQGRIDGKNATALAQQAGFPQSSVIYLDVETGPPAVPAFFDYYTAWIQALSKGGFSPGLYCSHLLASQFLAHDSSAVPWVFQLQFSGGHVFNPPVPTPNPSKSKFSGAKVLQFAQNCTLNLGTTQLAPVDLDTALVPDPSVGPSAVPPSPV